MCALSLRQQAQQRQTEIRDARQRVGSGQAYQIDVVDDNVEKPAAIQKHIGRRPIASFGNSNGDLEMLQWTTVGNGARFALLVHHNDATREWAYDRNPSIGQLDKALDVAEAKGWTVVDMKNDWRCVFPFE
jgi:hypothetical protein